MKTINKKTVKGLMILVALAGVVGCGGNEVVKEPLPSVSKDFGGLNASTGRAFNALSKVLGNESSQAQVTVEGESTNGELQSLSGSVPCDATGTVAYSGTVSEDSSGNGTFDLNLAFQSCDGIDGALTIAGHAFENEESVDIKILFNGALEGQGCQLTYSSLELTALGRFSEGVSQNGSGGFSVSCGEDSLACSYTSVDLSDEEAVSAGCTCKGAGCDAVLSVEVSTDDDDGDDNEDEVEDEDNEDDEDE